MLFYKFPAHVAMPLCCGQIPLRSSYILFLSLRKEKACNAKVELGEDEMWVPTSQMCVCP